MLIGESTDIIICPRRRNEPEKPPKNSKLRLDSRRNDNIPFYVNIRGFDANNMSRLSGPRSMSVLRTPLNIDIYSSETSIPDERGAGDGTAW